MQHRMFFVKGALVIPVSQRVAGVRARAGVKQITLLCPPGAT